MESVDAPLRDANGRSVGKLTVSRLPGRGDRLELEGERIVLEEEGHYVFDLAVDDSSQLSLQPREELFSFDDTSLRRGRLQPRQHVGRIAVRVQTARLSGLVTLSVRPKKLEEETEYRRMLDDIAEIATEAILQGFAPAATALIHDPATRPELLYQQFAFLHARLTSTGERDLALVRNRPHAAWIDVDELRSPGAPLRGGSRNLRSLSRPGPRAEAPSGMAIASLPQRVRTSHSEETLDTEPNRFILFALQRWRALALAVRELLTNQAANSGPISRGLDAADEVIELLDRAMTAPMFRDVGRLKSFPSGNQVLQGRAGYRELLRTFVLSETGARLELDWELEDAFAASQRNVATLYEYWAYLQLARSVGRVCGQDLSSQVLDLASDGLTVGFVRGEKSNLRWSIAVGGRDLTVELYFNREFRVSAKPDASWSRAMRPDCSVRVRPEGLAADVSGDDLSIWLHFDAKYRVEFAETQFTRPASEDGEYAAESEAVERVARSKREDLLKMHAYRDAIRRSAGAYVLYPGEQHHEPFTQHHEVLPGLGAFVLRPKDGSAVGTEPLERFLVGVLGHVADRATQHERSRFWQTLIHRSPPTDTRGQSFPQLSSPPSDSTLLCGYVRSAAHRVWVERWGVYNVRVGNRRGAVSLDDAVLAATDVLLYGPGTRTTLWRRAGAWFVQSKGALVEMGYPNPGGQAYLCCQLERRHDEPPWLAQLVPGEGRLRAEPPGAPFALSWQDLFDSLDPALSGE